MPSRKYGCCAALPMSWSVRVARHIAAPATVVHANPACRESCLILPLVSQAILIAQLSGNDLRIAAATVTALSLMAGMPNAVESLMHKQKLNAGQESAASLWSLYCLHQACDSAVH